MDTSLVQKQIAVASWRSLLNDQETLPQRPGAHHKVLTGRARKLYEQGIIKRDDLCEMLELADAALEYAIKANLDSEAA